MVEVTNQSMLAFTFFLIADEPTTALDVTIQAQQLGMTRERHRDHRALTHAARKLMRIGQRAASGIRNAHKFQHLHGRT